MSTVVIVILASLSYTSGVTAIFKGKYRPSIYSRLIWLLLAINSLVGVVELHNNHGSVALASIQAVGCVAMFVGALKYSVRTFGTTEKLCTILLALSAVIWLTAHSPLINVLISLTAHFIGAVPTLIAARKKPASENFLFWLFFAIASILAFITADKSHIQNFLYALYFAVFDSGMTILAARQYAAIEE